MITPRQRWHSNNVLSEAPPPPPTAIPSRNDHWAAAWNLLIATGWANNPETPLRALILWPKLLESSSEATDADWQLWRDESEALLSSLSKAATLPVSTSMLAAELHLLLVVNAASVWRQILLTPQPGEFAGDATFAVATFLNTPIGIDATTTSGTATFGPTAALGTPVDVSGGALRLSVSIKPGLPDRTLEVHVATLSGWTNYSKATVFTSARPATGSPVEVPVSEFTPVGSGANFAAIAAIRFRVAGGLATVNVGDVVGREAL